MGAEEGEGVGMPSSVALIESGSFGTTMAGTLSATGRIETPLARVVGGLLDRHYDIGTALDLLTGWRLTVEF